MPSKKFHHRSVKPTISLPPRLYDDAQIAMQERGYGSFSSLMQDALRRFLESQHGGLKAHH